MSTSEEQLLMQLQELERSQSEPPPAEQPVMQDDIATLPALPAVEEPSLEEQREAAIQRAQERMDALDLSQRRAEALDSPGERFEHGVAVGIAESLGLPVDAVQMILEAGAFPTNAPLGSGDNIMDVMEELGVIMEDAPRTTVGPEGAAGTAVGGTLVLTPAMIYPFLEIAGDPNFQSRQMQDYMRFHGTEDAPIPRNRAQRVAFALRQMGEQITRTAIENPKTFLATELGGAGASGYVVGAMQEAGAPPEAQMTAGVATAVPVSFSIAGIPRGVQSMVRWGMKNAFPWTEAGGQYRSAAQIQARSENPELEADQILRESLGIEPSDLPPNFDRMSVEEQREVLSSLGAARTGVTPARATENPRQMAQEQLMLDANPDLDRTVRQDLEQAVARTQRELRDLYDTPQGREDWEFAVMNRVNPDGDLMPDTAENMLRQVADNFGPLYAEVEGFPIRLHLMDQGRSTTLETMIENVPNTRTVIARGPNRDAIHTWLQGLMEDVTRRSRVRDGSPSLMSEELLEFRSAIRTRIRELGPRANTSDNAAEQRDLLRVAEQRFTQLLNEQLSPELLQRLQTTDGMYRNFSVVADALWRSNDRMLTPDALLRSLRRSASSHGAYAMGEGLEMRALANSGREIDSYMNSPAQARRWTGEMSEDQVQNVRNDFVDSIIRRSISPNVGPDGSEVIDGRRLLSNLNKYRQTGEAIGITPEEFQRLQEIGDQLRMLHNPNPGAVNRLFEDGPSTLMELLAAMQGSRAGTDAARAVGGNPLLLAGFFTNRARNFIARLTSDKATELMIQAVRDPVLYRHLLLKPNASAAEQNAVFQQLNSWLLALDTQTEEEEERREELRRLREEVEAAQQMSPLY